MTETEVIALARSIGEWRDPITSDRLTRIVNAALARGEEACVCNCARAGGACVVRNGGRLPGALQCARGVATDGKDQP